MDKYYDQSCPDCDTCGWFGQGQYPDGRTYDRCEWFGYILHERVEAKCKGVMSKAKVKEFKSRKPIKLRKK